jgi:hypothetical protein
VLPWEGSWSPVRTIRTARGSNCSSTRHEIEDENDDGENEQDMNPSTERVTADESYDPEDEKDDCDCPKHFSLS